MEASIKEPNIKHFVRLLQCAARYGDDLCMHATKDQWELSVTNSSKSAFCLFSLSPAFFHRYRAVGTTAQQRRGVKCKLYAKSVLGVLGKASSVNAVELIHLKIIDPEGGLRAAEEEGSEYEGEDDVRTTERSAQLEIKMVYTHGITKKHFLHLQASDFLRAIIDTNAAPCGFQIQAKTLRDWLDHFSIAFSSSTAANGTIKGDSQLAWRFSRNDVRVKNFENLNTAALMTEIKIDVGEFQDYEIDLDAGYVDLALPMREFKATLQLAEQFNMDLDFFFSEATQPLAMSSRFHGLDRDNNEKQLFTIFCVIATTSCDAFAQTPTPKAEPCANATATANASRAQSVAAKTEVEGSARKRRPDGSYRSSRPRASLSMTAHPAASETRMVTLPVGDPSLSQRPMSQEKGSDTATEPLFLPGASQGSIRMTQAEVLEMAGMNEDDLDAMMDDLDDEEMGGQQNETEKQRENDKSKQARGDDNDDSNDMPADWSDIDFANLPNDHMSTQKDAIAAAQAAHHSHEVSPSKSSPLHTRAQSALSLQPNVAEPPAGGNFARSHSTRSPDPIWEPDEDIFGPIHGVRPPAPVPSIASANTAPTPNASANANVAAATTDPVTQSSTPVTSHPPTLVPTEVSDEEFDADPVEPTQADGRKFQSFFDD